MDTAIFWDNIKTLIKQTNTTQRGLAVKCGFSPRSIETWIASNQLPDAFQTYTIAQNLGVSIEYLITGKNADNKETIERIRQLLQNVDTELDKL